MRAFLTISFCLTIFLSHAQNFVSPGIIAFHSGAYERTIADMNKAFEVSPNMDNDMKAKAYYYRGMARINLLKANSYSPVIGSDPYLNTFNDLTQAGRLDQQWREPAQKEMQAIYQNLVTKARASYNEGIYSNTEEDISRLFGSAILRLNTALQISNNFEVNDLLGKIYDAMGVWYDQLIDNSEARQKAVSSYKSAIKYYEASLEINPQTLSNIRALKQLSYRLGDREKEQKYAQLEADLGG